MLHDRGRTNRLGLPCLGTGCPIPTRPGAKTSLYYYRTACRDPYLHGHRPGHPLVRCSPTQLTSPGRISGAPSKPVRPRQLLSTAGPSQASRCRDLVPTTGSKTGNSTPRARQALPRSAAKQRQRARRPSSACEPTKLLEMPPKAVIHANWRALIGRSVQSTCRLLVPKPTKKEKQPSSSTQKLAYASPSTRVFSARFH